MASPRAKRLAALFFASNRAFRERMEASKATDPASMLRVAALAYVHARGTPTMKELAEHLCVTPPSATSLASALTKAGFLARRVGRPDRRTVRLGLTAKGSATLKKGWRHVEATVERLVAPLSRAEQDELIRLFEKFLA